MVSGEEQEEEVRFRVKFEKFCDVKVKRSDVVHLDLSLRVSAYPIKIAFDKFGSDLECDDKLDTVQRYKIGNFGCSSVF